MLQSVLSIRMDVGDEGEGPEEADEEELLNAAGGGRDGEGDAGGDASEANIMMDVMDGGRRRPAQAGGANGKDKPRQRGALARAGSAVYGVTL